MSFHVLALQPETLLEVFFIAHKNVDMFNDAVQSFLSLIQTTTDLPQLGSIVQVEGRHRSGGLGGLHAFDDDFRCCR